MEGVLGNKLEGITDASCIALLRRLRGSVSRTLIQLLYSDPEGAIEAHFDDMAARGLLICEHGEFREGEESTS